MFQQSVKLFFVACTIAVLAGSVSALIGGKEITASNAPYVVQLRDSHGFFCGGALISSRLVVSAAHCFEGIKVLQSITVVVGATSIHDKGVQSQVEDGYMPSNYDTDVVDLDVAVLLLKTPINGFKYVPLCNTPLKADDKLQVYGWGRTSEQGEISEKLRTVSLPILPRDLCILRYNRLGEKITDSMMCAYEEGKDACTSDSGGPAIFNGQLCGIVSWSLGCGHYQAPGVYTIVNEVKWFIEQVMAEVGK